MGRLTDYVAVGRSLATGLVVGIGSGDRARLLELADLADWLPAEQDVSDSRAIEGMLASTDLAGLQARMAAGMVTSVQLTAHLLRRIGTYEARLGTLVELDPTSPAQARQADARRAAGEAGALLGIPVTVKGNIDVAGMRTTAGAEILLDNVAPADAPVVAALRAAGAVVLGTANLSEFAGAVVRTPGFSAVAGQTVNPHGGAFTPGGSSSGSAAGVAAGLAMASVGTETSGSLVAPAAFNGVVGMKPSRGVLPGEGIVPLVRHQDSAGPIGRNVADVAALLAVLSGGTVAAGVAGMAADALEGVRVGVLRQAILDQRTPFEDTSDNSAVLQRIDVALRASGATAVDVSPVAAEPIAQFEAGLLTVVLGGVSHDTVGYLAGVGAPVATLGDLHAYNLRQPRRRIPAGQALLSLALARRVSQQAYEDAALTQREAAARILDDTFAAADADVLVSLANLHSALYSTAGYPAVTVPVGLRASGMPTGATLIGRHGADAALLRWAHAFEQAVGPRPVASPTS